jgi:2-polyprenyl-3-methyl-5-hydroxy-6-metoxy-1,4-benzoquinol methylase
MKLEYLNKCNLCESEDISSVDNGHNIFNCHHCGYIFDNPRPTFDEVINFYSREDQYDGWLKEEKGRDALWQRRLKLVKKFKKAGTLLDIGAGIGQFLYFAKDDFAAEGTEVSESAIKVAKQKYGLSLKKGQVEDIDFGDSRFDVITLFHVLEHVPNPSQLIRRCYDLLNQQGVLIIAVPNEIHSFIARPIRRLLSIFRIHSFRKYGVFGLPKIELDGTLSEIHLSHFTVSSLRRWLTKENFAVVEDTLDPYYVATGVLEVIHDLLFLIFLTIKRISNSNLYDTIWIVAKRK